ncbi:phosphatase PAP2 family protein [Microbacterium sp. 4R-513]|uniref:phosphatase PAP2 family protein n=1 Tax=Microbacterium sp. 4R-513 TaxID=2567934 RepID=UPI0013E0F5DE|nr:phosphatase PAP2 family protein [Microbacterium sp. 4R-513]QIG39846.1 phosphatase PAP2 family protein [Microbacterium sp. 4R-513]
MDRQEIRAAVGQPPSRDAAFPQRLPFIVVGIVLIAGAAGLGGWILFRGDPPFAIDVWWDQTLAAWHSHFMTTFSFVMNFLGGGWFGVFVVPIVVGGILLFLRRPWAAMYFIAASVASAMFVQILKHTFGRARPEDIIVLSDFGSFPSGHVANAATVAVALMVIFPSIWTVIGGVVWVLLMALSRTYLHAHWLSDTLGGAMVGTGVALLLAALFLPLMARDPRLRRADAALTRSAG